ncbi:MAG: hypothetical protein ABL971_04635 [Vicinamibacterales bacterium]
MLDWKRWVSSAAYATITTVVAVFSGFLGSVYQDEIVSAFPLRWRGPWGAISWPAVGFWSSLILFGRMFFARQRSDDAQRSALADTVQIAKDNTSRIEVLVRTMPPRAFRAQLAQMVIASHDMLGKLVPRNGRSDLTKDDLSALVRFLLNAMARLALIFDDQPLAAGGSAQYAGNIMLFVPSGPRGEPPASIEPLLRFHPSDFDYSRLRGVLLLRPDLSTTSDVADEPAPDPGVSSFALPVPVEAKSDGRWNALPGAPRAFLTEQFDGYKDAHSLGDWCEKSGNFLPSTVSQLREYFSDGDGSQIRSFVSRPLFNLDGTAFGVLNLHSNQTHILGEEDERLDDFFAMLTPLYLDLQSTAELLVQIEARGPEQSGLASK